MGKLKRIKFSLVFNRKGQLPKDGRALVQVRAYQNRKERYFSTGVYVEPEHWDDRNKRVLSSHPFSQVLNDEIFQFLRDLDEFEARMISRNRFFPIDRLHEFRDNSQNQKFQSFTSYFRHKLENEGLRFENLKNYRQTFHKLQDFRKTVYFEELSISFVRDFDRFLFSKKLCQNTVHKHHSKLRAIIYRAISEDIIKPDQNPYKSFKLKTGEAKRPVLRPDELASIERLEFEPGEERLERIRDIFLFTTYTGLRYSDVARICIDQVKQTDKGLILELEIQKTKKLAVLPLYALFRDGAGPSKPEKIVKKYSRELTRWKDSEEVRKYPIFRITNQYYNRRLKVISKRANLSVNLTVHVARRTFATILSTKVQAPVIQKVFRHASMRMTNIYIQLGYQVIEQELNKVEW